MNASKENALKAEQDINEMAEKMDVLVPGDEDRTELKRYLLRIQTFVEAAKRKLPTEAAYEKEKLRKRKHYEKKTSSV